MNIRCKLVHVSFWQFRVDDTTGLPAVCDCGISRSYSPFLLCYSHVYNHITILMSFK